MSSQSSPDDRFEEVLNGFMQRFGQKSKMIQENITSTLRSLKSLGFRNKLMSEQFKSRDQEKQIKERANTQGLIFLEESKTTPINHGHRSSSMTKGSDSLSNKTKVAVKNKITSMVSQALKGSQIKPPIPSPSITNTKMLQKEQTPLKMPLLQNIQSPGMGMMSQNK